MAPARPPPDRQSDAVNFEVHDRVRAIGPAAQMRRRPLCGDDFSEKILTPMYGWSAYSGTRGFLSTGRRNFSANTPGRLGTPPKVQDESGVSAQESEGVPGGRAYGFTAGTVSRAGRVDRKSDG